MNKRIKTEIALGIILILVVIIGNVIWMSGKNQVNPRPQTAQPQDAQTTQQNAQTNKINNPIDE